MKMNPILLLLQKPIRSFLYTLLYICVLWMIVPAVMAQPRFLSNTKNIKLGQVEWKHPVRTHYTVTNTGDKPLIITSVEPDCACTVPQWTSIIDPGEQGRIEVEFDAEALGHFQKSLAVYTNAEPYLFYLYFDGQVVRELEDYTRTHPCKLDNVRLDKEMLDFGDVQPGTQPSVSLDIVNLSDEYYEPVLMHLPVYLEAEAEPAVLEPGGRGMVTVTLHAERLKEVGQVHSSVYLSRFMGDKVDRANEIPVSFVLLPDFTGMSDYERRNAPAIRVSETTIDISSLQTTKKKVSHDVTLTNTGRSPLQIERLQVFGDAISVRLKKSTLRPGESTRLRVTIHKRRLDRTKHTLRLLMMTNDPERPKIELTIKAE